jgi:hypothetical protein
MIILSPILFNFRHFVNKANFNECFKLLIFFNFIIFMITDAVVNSLCYKPEGRGFDTRLGDFFFQFI